MQPTRIEFANTLRGLAALLVLVSHYVGVFWTSRDSVSHYTKLQPLPEQFETPLLVEWLHPHPWVNLGALGVGLFFIISGFVIPMSMSGRSRMSFAVARMWRIIPTYAAGFTVTLISLYWAMKVSGVDWPYSLKDVILHYIPGIRDHFRTVNIDGIIWTLEVEVKFYIIMILLYKHIINRPKLILLLTILLVVFSKLYMSSDRFIENNVYIVSFVLRPFAISTKFVLLMFMGVSFYLYFSKKIDAMFLSITILVQLILFAYLWKNFSTDVLMGAFVSYVSAIPLFVMFMILNDKIKPNAITSFFADISYPLYVVHAVFGYIIMTFLLMRGWSEYAVIGFATIASISVAYFLHYFVEKPTQRIGRQRTTPSRREARA